MGILNRRDVFEAKYITALILDASNRAWFVPVKSVINEYFICDLEKQLYVFRIDGTQIFTYRHSMSKSFSLVVYNVKHYLPINPEADRLRQILEEHSLPKVGTNLLATLTHFASREKKRTDQTGRLETPHDITQFIEELASRPDRDEPVIHNLIIFLRNLPTDKIVLPIRSVAEYLDSDLMATDPKFLGLIAQTLNVNLEEQRKLANKPVTGKKPMMKLIAIMGIVGAVIAIAYMMFGDGSNSAATSLGGGLLGGPSELDRVNDIINNYSPDELIAAIQSGEISEADLPPDIVEFARQHVEETARIEAANAAEAAEAARLEAAQQELRDSLEGAVLAGPEGQAGEAPASGFLAELEGLGLDLPNIEIPEPPNPPAPANGSEGLNQTSGNETAG